MKLLALLVLLFPAAALAQPAAHPALYSFNDVYRLTVDGPPWTPPADAHVRFAATAPPAPEARFTVRARGPADKWMLIVAGLALAGWVARRRLASPVG